MTHFAVVTTVVLMMTLAAGLFSWLGDPRPGSGSLWGQLPQRGRGVVRVAFGCLLAALVGVAQEVVGIELLSPSALESQALHIVAVLFAAVALSLVVWGLAAMVFGRPWAQLAIWVRGGLLILLVPVVGTVEFVALLRFVDRLDELPAAQWAKSRNPTYRDIEDHALRLAALERGCGDSLLCRCGKVEGIRLEAKEIRDEVALHPELRGFSVMAPPRPGADTPPATSAFTLDWVDDQVEAVGDPACAAARQSNDLLKHALQQAGVIPP